MFAKTLAAVSFTLLIAGAGATHARADVDININLGFGGYYGPNISCREGARIVDERFSRVEIRSCAGRYYDYTGKRNGKWYWIKVNRDTGRIVDVRRWYR